MINVKSSYSGDLTVSGSITLTFAEGIFLGGTFNGGSIPITFTESLRINGNAFTSTSAILSIAGDFTYNGSSFTHNSGTVLFKKGSATTTVFSGTSNGGTSLTLYKAEFAATAANTQFMIRNITVHVLNEMKLSGTYQLFLNTNTSSTVEVEGNIISSNTASVGGGTVLLLVNGTGAQTINDNQGTSISGKLPNIKINKASGTLSLYGSIGMGGSTTLEYVAGTISAGTSRLVCYYNNTLYNNSGGTMTLSKLDWIGSGGTHSVTGKIMVTDTFSTSGTGNCVINGDTLELQGNMVWNNTSSGSGGNVVYKFSGSAEQIISGAVTAPLSKVRLKKSSGDISLLTPVNITTDLKFETGYIVPDTVNWVIFNHGATATGASENSFVKGTVKKIGNSSFVFPVGKDTIYNPIAITAPSSSTDAFRAEYFNFTQPHGFNKDTLTYLSSCEYWTLNRTAGSSSVKVTLHWNSNSCAIYTLSTLRIARWDGTKWNNTGPVTITGNTTTGTIQTNSNQSAFGEFLIGKRSPAVVANAGNDATINLGSTATLGGSPAASGGVSPYAYQWITDYTLSSATTTNPTAKPFSSYTYYLKVTDSDGSFDLDTVNITVNGFELKTAARFPILTDDTLEVTSPLHVVGAIGARLHLSGTITATDSILLNTSNSNLAIRHLDTAMQKIDGLTASAVSATLNGQTISGGVFRVNSNATLNGTLTLNGNSSSFIVIDINGDLTISDNSEIVLNDISWNEVFIHANNITINGGATLNGIFMLEGAFNGDITDGDVGVMAIGYVRGDIISGLIPLEMKLVHNSQRPIENFFGYNASNVIQEFGYGSEQWQSNINNGRIKELKPGLLRYPGGADANWWRWQTGWFRGYDNPIYNSVVSPSGYVYKDPVPLPYYCYDGLPWDLKAKKWQLNYLSDFKKMSDAAAAFPIFDLNMMSSDIGTEIGGLFKAHCIGIPIKYIELGNELYFSSPEKNALYEFGYKYAQDANTMAEYIHTFFPEAEICINAARSKGPNADKLNLWNDDQTGIEKFLIEQGGDLEFNALSFHIYLDLELKPEFTDCDLDTYSESDRKILLGNLFSTPYVVFDGMQTQESTEYQKEFELLEEYSLEGWLTEFNQEDDNYNLRGRWAHGIFTTLMALRALQTPGITKATCFDLFDGANRDIVFSTNSAFQWDVANCDENTDPVTAQWQLGAAGHALRYLGMATKNAYSARLLSFGAGSPEIIDANDQAHPGIYGWIFSNKEYGQPYSAQDSNWAVILNLTGMNVNIKTYDLFPLGGQSFMMHQDAAYTTEATPLAYVRGLAAVQELDEDILNLPTSPSGTVKLPAYSILLLRSGNQTMIGTPHIEVSNSTACKGKKVNLYLSCTGAIAGSYVISPPPSSINYSLSTTTATVAPVGNVTYNVLVNNVTQGDQTIAASAIPLLITTVGTPVCPQQEITLEVNSATSGLVFNWYPSPDYVTFYNEDELTISAPGDITYTVNASDGKCYCGSEEVLVDILDTANAGPDIYVCTLPEEPVILGGAVSYPGATSISWDIPLLPEGAPELSSTSIAQPMLLVPPDGFVIGNYTYTLLVNYNGCEDTNKVLVRVLDCCAGDDENLTFNPYSSASAGNYWTASEIALKIDAYLPSNSTFNDNGTSTDPTDDYYSLLNLVSDEAVTINGLLYIDHNLKLVNTEVKMGNSSKIIIEPNYYLDVNKSQLTGCVEMWQGIEVIGNLRDDKGLFVHGDTGDSSHIEDAINGIHASKDSRVTLQNSVFRNNYNHIWIDNYRFGFRNGINGNYFRCDEATMKLPHLEERTNIGILLEDVANTASGEIDGNTIHTTAHAIYSWQTGLFANNNIINNAIGYAIVSWGAMGENIFITNNSIDNFGAGIYSGLNSGGKTSIINNNIGSSTTTIAAESKGIKYNDVYPSDEEVVIKNNDVTAFDHAGIVVYNTQNINIEQNTVVIVPEDNALFSIGIQVVNSLNDTVDNNTIQGVEGGYLSRRGIVVDASPGTIIRCNEIDEVEYGLQFLGPNNDIVTGANEFKVMEKAMVLGEIDYTSGTLNDQTYSLEDGLTPGNIFTGNGGSVDQFGTTGDALYCIEYYNPNILYYSKECDINPYSDPEEFSDDNISSTYLSNKFQLDFNNPIYESCVECSNIEIIELTPYTNSLDFIITENSLEFSIDQTDCYRWSLKQQLYKKIKSFPELREHSPFDIFYDTTSTSSIGEFWLVDSLISLLNDTSLTLAAKSSIIEATHDKNNLISVSEIYQTNLKLINEIYLNTILPNRLSFSVQIEEDVLEIANQCPYVGGIAVYRARGIYSLFDESEYFNDAIICSLSTKLIDSSISTQSVIRFEVFPNPANYYSTVVYDLGEYNSVDIIISDILEREIDRLTLFASSNQITFDVSNFPDGVYNLKFYSGKQYLNAKKLVIVK